MRRKAIDKTFESEELVYAVDVAYADMDHAVDLLHVAQEQNKVIIPDAGLQVAKSLLQEKQNHFNIKVYG
ncbi:MAG TPA: hypothetical protein VMY77_11570 [Chitinophagaceae bacterium]|nr:hypothetical protein [Chitinophagaceae bacterium]